MNAHTSTNGYRARVEVGTSIADRIPEGIVPEWTLADRLAKARTAAGLSQADIAELLDCSVGSVARWEKGLPVKRSAVLHYALVTGVSFVWLMTGETPAAVEPVTAPVTLWKPSARPGKPMVWAVAA